MAHPTVTVLERHLLLYQRLWRASVFSFFVLPALFLVSVGLGIGAYVNDIDGVRYLTWIAPGLLASTAFQIGINESTFGIFTDFEWIGTFHIMRNTRVRITDMIAGWLLYIVVVVEIAVVAFLIVSWLFGVHQPLLLLAGPPACALLALAVATPTTAYAATIRDDGNFQLLAQFGIIPMTLVSGVYFPVAQLPAVLRPVSYASPLWHGVQLVRDSTLHTGTAWTYAVHIGYLIVWVMLGWAWATIAFRRRLAG
jgi:Nod factor-specific ABC transporter NodJ protein